jgi:hypothetical protein
MNQGLGTIQYRNIPIVKVDVLIKGRMFDNLKELGELLDDMGDVSTLFMDEEAWNKYEAALWPHPKSDTKANNDDSGEIK